MSDNHLLRGDRKVRQPTSFDEFDFNSAANYPVGNERRGTSSTDPWANESLFTGSKHHGHDFNLFLNNDSYDGYGNAPTATVGSGVAENKAHLCAHCPATYRRLGDLTRHQKEKHNTASSKFLCPIKLCPHSIAGEGFGRMYRLVDHLKSNKHAMDAKEAAYMARQHNLPKSKVTGNGGLGEEEAL